MHQAPRYDPLEQSDFFADQRSARPLIEGTVARGFLRSDKAFYTGKRGEAFLSELPVPLTKGLLLRGQEQFNIYCSPCHSRLGDGNGMIVQRGFKRAASLHDERLRTQPIGYFYDVISNGFGAMPDYAAQMQPQDRWAVAAYVRALQFSRHAPVDALTDADRRQIDGAATAPAASGEGGTTAHE
jgi:mono/diheme cytochrome c family protein